MFSWCFCDDTCACAPSGDEGFDVDKASLTRDKDLLDRARIAFDAVAKGKSLLILLPQCKYLLLLPCSCCQEAQCSAYQGR